MAALIALALRHWPATLGLMAVAGLAGLLAFTAHQRDAARAGWESERQAHRLFAERVRGRAGEIARRALERARRVEAGQHRITEEVSNDYQARLAALRADHGRRLRHAAGGADPGRRGDRVPVLPGPARGPDAAAEAGQILAFACEANALQLGSLQKWVARQVAAARPPKG